jgi:hypothetical protein
LPNGTANVQRAASRLASPSESNNGESQWNSDSHTIRAMASKGPCRRPSCRRRSQPSSSLPSCRPSPPGIHMLTHLPACPATPKAMGEISTVALIRANDLSGPRGTTGLVEMCVTLPILSFLTCQCHPPPSPLGPSDCSSISVGGRGLGVEIYKLAYRSVDREMRGQLALAATSYNLCGTLTEYLQQ